MGTTRSAFWYDVTREMRRLALKGRLDECFPTQTAQIQDVLLGGGRIIFSPDDEGYYRELELDQILHDPRTGRSSGLRRL